MKKIRIVAVTGTRADYSPLSFTLRRIRADRRFDLKIVATGMHVEPRHGSSWRLIEADGLAVHRRVRFLEGGDREIDVARALGRGVSRLGVELSGLAPDLVLLLGDQITALAAASACLPLRIPVAHVHGGESTRGLIDDQIRHAVTKLSHLHFASTPQYARRLVRMGEEPWRVRVVGATGLEALRRLKAFSRQDLGRRLSIDWSRPVYLFTYHPVTLRKEVAQAELNEVLAAVSRVEGQWIVSGTNADAGGRALAKRMRRVLQPHGARFFENLGHPTYLSLMKWSTAMVGNSSSGIIEAPSLGLPVVNIGERQGGRIRGANVIDVPARREEILRAIRRASGERFRKAAAAAPNPYDRGDASAKIVAALARLPDRSALIAKPFHDAP